MSANTRAPSTIVTIALSGQTEFTIPFEYLARKYVEVTLLGIDRLPLVLNTDFRFVNKTLISLTKPYTAEYKQIELRRVTSATERLVDFHDGSILRAYDLNLSQIQTLHVAEEARDLVGEIISVNDDGNLDARGRRIVQLGNGVDDLDAVNLGQLKLYQQQSAYSEDTVWNRLIIDAQSGKTFATYSEQGRVLTPRLRHENRHYVPLFDANVPVTFNSTPQVGTDGTLTIGTDKGERSFSKASAEAFTRSELADVKFLSDGSSVARELGSRHSDVINVLDYGAVGDGVVDDSGPVTSAIQAAKRNRSVLYIPKGTYKLGSVDTLDVPLHCEDGVIIINANPTQASLVSSTSGKVTWTNLTFDGNGTASVAFSIAAAEAVTLRNVGLTKFTGRCAILEQPVSNVRVHGGVVSDCSGQDVFVVKSTGNVISGVRFRNIAQHAIRFGRFSSDLDIDTGCNSVVSDCVFTDVYNDPILCELNSKFITIEDNTFTRCRNIAKVTSAADKCHSVVISGNTLREPKSVSGGFVNGVSAIDTDRVTVTDNHIDLTGSTVGDVHTQANAGIVVGTNGIVSGNTIVGPVTTGVQAKGASIVANNRISDVANNGVVSGGADSIVQGNIISSTTDGVTGIRVAGASSVITGNRTNLTGSSTTGIVGISTATDILVTGNNLKGVAAATRISGAGSLVENNIV